jgi:hypothetical protein
MRTGNGVSYFGGRRIISTIGTIFCARKGE